MHSSPSSDNAYAPALADLRRRIAALRAAPPDKHDAQVDEALSVMPFVVNAIIPYYQSQEHIHHAGGADRIVSTILLQVLACHLDWPDDYRAITHRYRNALLVPQFTIDTYVQKMMADGHRPE